MNNSGNEIHSLKDEEVEVIEPNDKGAMSTSSGSKKHSKKRGNNIYNPPTSQTSNRRYKSIQSRS